jgi:hypothetical protein
LDNAAAAWRFRYSLDASDVGRRVLSGQVYSPANHPLVAMIIFFAFELLFCLAALMHKRYGNFDRALTGAALIVCGMAMFWTFYLSTFSSIANRPALLFSYLFMVDAGLLTLVFAKDQLARLLGFTGSIVFLFLAW